MGNIYSGAIAGMLPNLNHATVTDAGRKRLANEDAAASDPLLGIFTVCDGIGGQPAGEAASQIAAYSIRHLIRSGVRRHSRLDDAALREVMTGAAERTSRGLRDHAQPVEALRGMGCTVVTALLDARAAFILNAGDSAAFLCRGGDLRRLSTDHTKVKRVRLPPELEPRPAGSAGVENTDEPPSAERDPLVDPSGDFLDATTQPTTPPPGQAPPPPERRLLTRFLGMRNPLKPAVTSLPLEPGDRLLLCTDGLTDPVDPGTIGELLCEPGDPRTAAVKLVQHANDRGGPDNVTVTVIDYLGPRSVTDADRAEARAAAGRTAPLTAYPKLRAALALVEQDLYWLQEHTLLTLAAAGEGAAARPHLESTAADAPWTKRYSRHIEMLQQHLEPLTSGENRPSPLLDPHESAAIFTALWYDWQRIEHRYLSLARRRSPPANPVALNRLLKHMVHSVRTLNGLLEFLPGYLADG